MASVCFTEENSPCCKWQKLLMALPAEMLMFVNGGRCHPSVQEGHRQGRVGTLMLLLSDPYKHTVDASAATLSRQKCLCYLNLMEEKIVTKTTK